MASKLLSVSLLLMLFCSPSLADSSISTTPETICNYTRFPNFCKSSLPSNKPGTIHDFAKISLQQSFSHAQKFLGLVRQNSKSTPSAMYNSSLLALEDCSVLAQQNIDFLSNIQETLNSSNDVLQTNQVDDLQTLLSATLTNIETCLDGLMLASDSSIKNALLPSISNGTMHYSVALALFTHGWPRGSKKGRFLTERNRVFSYLQGGGRRGLQLIMSRKDELVYERVGRRRLLQASNSTGNVTVSQFVVVNPNGAGNFTTITDAVAAAPNNSIASNGYFVIYVVAGVYNEYVSIESNKKYLMMIGEGINQTVITGNRSVVDGWTTFNSATFIVKGQGFVAVNLTFQNTAGAIKHQAVAVRNGADLSTFYKCSFEGYQDTLYTHSLRQFYRECDIYGTIDYIFGNAAVVLQNCNIFSRLPMNGQFNALTAQGRTDPNQNTGTSIQNCTIKASDDLASSNGTTKTYLGRPWKEYSRTVVMQSFIDSLVDPAGWAAWSGDFALSTLYYAEFNNTGPGSNTTNRVTWPGYHLINETDAVSFTVSQFVVGDFWLPATGVPYLGGLQ